MPCRAAAPCRQGRLGGGVPARMGLPRPLPRRGSRFRQQDVSGNSSGFFRETHPFSAFLAQVPASRCERWLPCARGTGSGGLPPTGTAAAWQANMTFYCIYAYSTILPCPVLQPPLFLRAQIAIPYLFPVASFLRIGCAKTNILMGGKINATVPSKTSLSQTVALRRGKGTR